MKIKYLLLLAGFILIGFFSCKNREKPERIEEFPETDVEMLETDKTVQDTITVIIGGEPVENISEIPWQTALVDPANPEKPFCGGSILSNQWIVTAAHCVYNINYQQPDLYILSGTNNIKESGIRSEVRAIYIHPDYNSETLDNDIALIQLESPLTLGRNQNSIRIPDTGTYDDLVIEGLPVTVSGWGNTDPDYSSQPDILHKVDIFVKNSTECSNYYTQENEEVTENMICAADFNKDACQGDSGGPLFMTSENQTPFLVGIVSWGISCAEPYLYGVYTKTGIYQSWIRNTIQRNNGGDIAI